MVKLILALTCLSLVVPCQAEVIVYFPMDSNPNWTTEGQWEFGVPQGEGGPQSYDPTSGYTGSNVYGYNLAGNYENDMPEYRLTTSALNCALAENVRLSFWRWLGVESSLFDHARIQVSNNGTNWIDVWLNGEDNLADTSWVYCEYDISAVADRQPTVFIRWCMGPTDFSFAYSGWNIDDVCLDGDISDALFISPSDSFVSLGPEGGPFSPACKSYTLTNNGSSALNWTAEGTQSWLDVTLGTGTLFPGASVVVEICINSSADTLAEGKYTDIVSFTNTNSGFSYSIDVMLYVENKISVPLQYPTIQAAIDASLNGDTIIVMHGTYSGNGNRDIDFKGKAITVRSIDPDNTCVVAATIIDCQGSVYHPYRGFIFQNGEDANSILAGFTIENGYDGYKVCDPYGECFCYNRGKGGGIYCESSPTLMNCIIKDCGVGCNGEGEGGGMYNTGNPTLINCTFKNNYSTGLASIGGGMYNAGDPTLINCIFSENHVVGRAGRGGGGMYNTGNPTLIDCIFSKNKSDFSGYHSSLGGGGMSNSGGNPTLTNCVFDRNLASYCRGAGIHNYDGGPILSDCNFSSNSATYGAGMYNVSGSAIVINCIFSNNSSSQDGGGVYNSSSNAMFTNCLFRGNYTYRSSPPFTRSGGGIYNMSSGPILTNCTFARNSSDDGGGIYNSTGKPTLTNCIFWGNSDDGGVDESAQIYTEGVGGPVINYSCIQGWTGDFGGSGNIDADPCFADSTNGDYHLKSQEGRWDANSQSWVKDDVTSPCIDAGDPTSYWTAELWPHGKRINMGAYGGTPQASMSPLIDLGYIADLNNDDKVDFGDLKLFTNQWQNEQLLLSEDLDRNGFVDFTDFAIFGQQWSYPSALEPGISYQVEDCNMEGGENQPFAADSNDTRFSVRVEGSYIHFEDLITANCCLDEIELQMTVEDGLITIYEIEHLTAPCTCICDYPTTATLGPFEAGNYLVEVIDVNGSSLGFVVVTIGGTAEPGIVYQIEDCDGQAAGISTAEQTDTTRFTVIVDGLYIHFEDLMYANCCPDKLELEMTVEDNLITIYEIEYVILEGCRCMCGFPITATLGPFEPGTYTLEVYQNYGGFIGSTTFTIGPDE